MSDFNSMMMQTKADNEAIGRTVRYVFGGDFPEKMNDVLPFFEVVYDVWYREIKLKNSRSDVDGNKDGNKDGAQ